MYLYRAVDKKGRKIDFFLSPRRKRRSAQAFLIKAINQNGLPSLINIDKSGANRASIKIYNKRNRTKIKCKSCKYLNNIVEQDHRWARRHTRVALGFKAFHSAHATLAGVEAARIIAKGQLRLEFSRDLTTVEQFQRLVG